MSQQPSGGRAAGPRGGRSRSGGRPRSWAALLALLLIAGAAAYLVWGPSDGDGAFSPTLPWLDDSAAALAQARDRNLPVLMVFTRPRCIYCERLLREVLDRPAFEAVARGRVVLAMLDVQADARYRRLLESFGGDSVPMLVLTDPTGKPLATRIGAADAKTVIDWLGAELNRFYAEQKPREPAAAPTTAPAATAPDEPAELPFRTPPQDLPCPHDPAEPEDLDGPASQPEPVSGLASPT